MQLVLTGVAIATMLTWGVYAGLWTFPNDEGSIIQAVLNGEYQSGYYPGPSGNGTIIPAGSQAQFIVMYRTQNQGGGGGGSSLLPNGLGWVEGPHLWTTPSATPTSLAKYYAIFTISFITRTGYSGNATIWFTGPQGNLTSSYNTSKHGGLDLIPLRNFNTAILEASAAGNYTLHYLNRNTSANVTGAVVLGPSLVTFTRPYLIPGLVTIAVAVGLSTVTVLNQVRGDQARRMAQNNEPRA